MLNKFPTQRSYKKHVKNVKMSNLTKNVVEPFWRLTDDKSLLIRKPEDII